MPPRLDVVLTTTRSDSHTWNLIYIERWLCEHGCDVLNLGNCVEPDVVAETCRDRRPDLLVVSSINGLGASRRSNSPRP